MIIVGGTYSEICSEPDWNNIYGSGLRAVHVILENDKEENVEFYTCADKSNKEYLEYYEFTYPKLKNFIQHIPHSPQFYYDHPLKTPIILPRPDILSKQLVNINVEGENILAYGMIDANIKINGKKVVYDPQSPVNPQSFKSTLSSAEKLITIVNIDEARTISGYSDISDIKNYFFNNEECHALIIKMGAKGAYLFQDKISETIHIPVYETKKVWSIGSGDVFAAFFAMNWFKEVDIIESARLASKATSIYCNSKDLLLLPFLDTFDFPELSIPNIPKGQIYLAAPFFTFGERWVANQARNALKGIGLNVFSPFHDVGHGKAFDVVHKDIEGLNDSEIVFAIVDGLDSGTLFEIGYAIAQNKKIVAFVQNESEESLKMLEGTNCIIEKDFTTAIYKLYWHLGRK